MNKAELIDTLAAKTNLGRKDVENLLEAFETTVIDTLKVGGEVTLTGFGTFLARHRESRMGVNPQRPTEKITIPAVTVPKFRAGKTLKDALKQKLIVTVPSADQPITS